MLYKHRTEKIMTSNIFIYALSEFSSDKTRAKVAMHAGKKNDTAVLLIVHSYLVTVKAELPHGPTTPFLDTFCKVPSAHCRHTGTHALVHISNKTK